MMYIKHKDHFYRYRRGEWVLLDEKKQETTTRMPHKWVMELIKDEIENDVVHFEYPTHNQVFYG